MPIKVPKMVLKKFSGNPLDWLESSGQFIATIEESGYADSVKTNFLKTLITGKTKAAIEGIGCSSQTYHVAWQTLAQDFRKDALLVKPQPEKIHAYPFITPRNFSEIVLRSGFWMRPCACTFWIQIDIGSESLLKSAVLKSSNKLKKKWLTYLQI